MSNGLLSVTEAKAMVLSHFSTTPTINIKILSSRGKVLAQPIYSPMDFPAFNNSSMDGFTLMSSDTRQASQDYPVILTVIGDIPAGSMPNSALRNGSCMRIMTGAPLPDRADAVVPLEFVSYEPTSGILLPTEIRIHSPVSPGEYVRPIGSDIQKGQLVISKGERLRPQEIGLLAMLGIPSVHIHRPPRVALLSTGSELTHVGKKLKPGRVYDANSYSLGSLILQSGGELVNLHLAKDDPSTLVKKLDEAVSKKVDLIVTSAGVSVGAYDFMKQILEENGNLAFWRVNMRPGKPLAFGAYKGIPFMGLPGNPVSAFVGFEVFIRPVINKMSGYKNFDRPRFPVLLSEPIISDGRESYLRGQVWFEDGHFNARLSGHQGSGNLFSLVQSNAFLIVPSEVKSLPIGSRIDAWIFDETDLGKTGSKNQ